MEKGVTAFGDLLTALADLYAVEGRAGAQSAADALRRAVLDLPSVMPRQSTHYTKVLRSGLAIDPQPIVQKIIAAMPYIRWGGSDLREGRIPDDLANQMPMCELVGPDGMMWHETVRVGLWMQQAGVVYGPRQHLAEETFLIFAGRAFWSQQGGAPSVLASGQVVHHPSNVFHTSRTTDTPVFAAWRWSGDIGFDGYSLRH